MFGHRNSLEMQAVPVLSSLRDHVNPDRCFRPPFGLGAATSQRATPLSRRRVRGSTAPFTQKKSTAPRGIEAPKAIPGRIRREVLSASERTKLDADDDRFFYGAFASVKTQIRGPFPSASRASCCRNYCVWSPTKTRRRLTNAFLTQILLGL